MFAGVSALLIAILCI